MPRLFRVFIAVAILVLTFGAGRWAHGQTPQFPSQQPDPNAPIISGADIGFRVDRQQSETLGRITGTWVVRVNGQWIEPAASLRGRPLGTR